MTGSEKTIKQTEMMDEKSDVGCFLIGRRYTVTGLRRRPERHVCLLEVEEG